MNYIHNNPVKAGIAEKPEHSLYNNAKGYYLIKKCGLLDLVFLQKDIFSLHDWLFYLPPYFRKLLHQNKTGIIAIERTGTDTTTA